MTLKYTWRSFSLGCHFHVHFSYPWHAFASHGLPAISELLVVFVCCEKCEQCTCFVTSPARDSGGARYCNEFVLSRYNVHNLSGAKFAMYHCLDLYCNRIRREFLGLCSGPVLASWRPCSNFPRLPFPALPAPLLHSFPSLSLPPLFRRKVASLKPAREFGGML